MCISFIYTLLICFLFSEHSTWMTSKDSTPTKMRANPCHTSGKSSILRTIPSGLENTNTMMNLPRCSWAVTWLQVNDKKNNVKLILCVYFLNVICFFYVGMFQRLDKMRKQAFSSVCLFGEDNNSSISGVWVWRGQELAFNVSNK